jgi:hypothetical protein
MALLMILEVEVGAGSDLQVDQVYLHLPIVKVRWHLLLMLGLGRVDLY